MWRPRCHLQWRHCVGCLILWGNPLKLFFAVMLYACCGLWWSAVQAEAEDDGQPRQQFAIWEYQVQGNSLLAATAIELALTPYLGPQQNIDRIHEAAASLERAYRDAGYPTVAVNVPEQDVVGGRVLLVVVEGKVSRVRVSGSRYHLLSEIRGEVESLQPGQPIHIGSFQDDLNRLNRRSRNLRVTPVLKPGRTPGTVEVDLRVRDELPLWGSLEVNNHNSLDTSDARVALDLGFDNLWQRHHSLSLQFQNTPEQTQESRVWAGTYILPLIDDVTRVALYAVKSESEVSSLTDLTVVGAGNIFGARFVRALGSQQGYVHSLSLGFDYKDFDQSVNLAGADSDSAPIRYTNFTAMYNGTVLREAATTRIGMSLTHGMREFLGGGKPAEFDRKRLLSRANFLTLQGNLRHQHQLGDDWSMLGRLRFQVADSPLISNEQFSAGGASSVRGYYESQELGDHGAAGALELVTPNLLAETELRGRVFIDGAWMQIIDQLMTPVGGGSNFLADVESSIASAGLGLDFKWKKRLSATLDAGYALKDATDIDKGDIRVHGSVLLEF